MRAAGGSRSEAATSLGLLEGDFTALLARHDAERDAEAYRTEKRAQLQRKATLAERARLLTRDEARLRDLGILEELWADVKARLPDHMLPRPPKPRPQLTPMKRPTATPRPLLKLRSFPSWMMFRRT